MRDGRTPIRICRPSCHVTVDKAWFDKLTAPPEDEEDRHRPGVRRAADVAARLPDHHDRGAGSVGGTLPRGERNHPFCQRGFEHHRTGIKVVAVAPGEPICNFLIDRHEEVELSLSGLHLGNVDVKEADRVGFEPKSGRFGQRCAFR
jgi:hypothetical protein